MSAPVCPNEHTVHHEQDGGEHFWITCGDEVLDEQVFLPSREDLTPEIQSFLRATMRVHEVDILRSEVDRLRGAIDAHQTEVFAKPYLANPADERLWAALDDA